MAELVVRLHRLAEEHAARGDRETATELASLAQVTLLSTSELLSRLDAARARAEARASNERPADDEEPDEAAEDEAAEGEAPEETPRRVRRARRRAPPAHEEADEPPADPPPPAEDADARLGERLARLAGRVSEIEATDENRVAIEGIQTRLIEADRARAEGMTRRAADLAAEAERLLASLTGGPTPPEPPSGDAFLRDARAQLGSRARVHGSTVAVRLDPILRWHDDAWHARTTAALDGLRALARGYRAARLTLVTVGDATAPAFGDEPDALRRYLAHRFQIREARLRWAESTRLPLSRGTYLLVVHEAGGG
ncbi:MAG TPA: hypothetical protein RMH99_24825 [Sandaracinaceae bacterium LLY-WYZ-13_1]|nr:hypothetical protein [Sandaracinaceae bacterium LLY-WYZ-13_1]